MTPTDLIELLRGVEACEECLSLCKEGVPAFCPKALGNADDCPRCALKIIAAMGEKAAEIAGSCCQGLHTPFCLLNEEISNNIKQAFGVEGKGE